jgi:hypothetical protein
MPTTLTPQTFVAKWRPIELHERAMAQEHFIDLCRLLDHPTPTQLSADTILARLLALNLARVGGGKSNQ